MLSPSPSLTSADVRDALVQTLVLDLVGPGPHDAERRQEVLPATPPSRWYLTGFLAPSTASAKDRTSDDVDDEEDLAAGAEDDASDGEPEEIVAPTRPQFPSSIGMSVLVGPNTSQLVLTVTWGTYRKLDRAGVAALDPDGSLYVHESDWQRTPHTATLVLALDAATAATPLPLREADGSLWGLFATVLVRDLPAPERSGLITGTRAVSVFVQNRRATTAGVRDPSFAFQVDMTLHCDQGFAPRANVADQQTTFTNDDDARVADLQFRDLHEFAVGHGVATHAADDNGVCRVLRSTWIPQHAVPRVQAMGTPLQMRALADAADQDADRLASLLQPLLSDYQTWLTDQQTAAAALPTKRRDTAQQLVGQGHAALQRMQRGLALLQRDDTRRAFAEMNRAMARAQQQGGASTAEPAWRAFQIAFVLLNLEGIVDPTSPDRATAELIYFPTGGGKTEAYLGVACFAMLWRRLAHPADYEGVCVLMRYTLRLLTLDQLGRATRLVCAMELMRRGDPAVWGRQPFQIGLWVGGAATPNQIGSLKAPTPGTARLLVRRYHGNSQGERPVPIQRCAWCDTELSPQSYQITENDRGMGPTLRIVCPSEACPFSDGDQGGLPVLTVDENVYEQTPAFVIATVDKFAQLCWTQASGRLLGHARADRAFETRLRPPDLLIQDELHLISGPLGTMVGAYEVAVDLLARQGDSLGAQAPVAKVITATATVRRAAAQIRALYGREVQIFPPRGPHRDDAFFAQTVPLGPTEAGRLYVGISAPGRSLKVVLLRVYSALLAATSHLHEELKATNQQHLVDPYLTLLGYFSSLRELGGSRRIVEDEVASRVQRSYFDRHPRGVATPFRNRLRLTLQELTSRVSTTEVAAAKDSLAVAYDQRGSLDMALATNMISVGLDVSRLGLMVVLGRPKTTSEYIQATSRVGRDQKRPGLVITLFNPYRVRDRSHFERFAYDHAAFYRNVEAVSVTPFAARALDRSIAPVVVAIARHLLPDYRPVDGAHAILQHRAAFDQAIDALVARVSAAVPQPEHVAQTVQRVRREAQDVLEAWTRLAKQAADDGVPLVYRDRDLANAARLLREPLDADAQRLDAPDHARMRAPWSLRDVEPVSALDIASKAPR